jgi:hypothetical protein
MGEVLEAVRTGPDGLRRPVALERLAADQAIAEERAAPAPSRTDAWSAGRAAAVLAAGDAIARSVPD